MLILFTQKGIGYRIFERDNGSRSSRDWGMSMHWGAEFLSSVLPADLVDRLHEIDTDPYHDASKDAGYVQCNGETGEILVVMKSSTPKRVSRARFRGLLNDGLNIEVGNQHPQKTAHQIRNREIRSCAWILMFSAV